MRVFVPRADPCDRFVGALRDGGHEVSHAALTETVDMPGATERLATALHGLDRARDPFAELSVSLNGIEKSVDSLAVPNLVTRACRAPDWVVLTSARTVCRIPWPLAPGVRLAVVGRATATALPVGVRPDVVAANESGQGLADELEHLIVPGARVVLPGSAQSDPLLAERLRARGAEVVRVAVYDTVAVPKPPAQLVAVWPILDAVVLLASSQARALNGFDLPRKHRLALIALGEPTARTCVSLGWPVTATANEPTPSGVFDALG